MTQDELDQAIADFHKADTIQTQATELRDAAREKILQAKEEGLCEVGKVKNSDGSLTVSITQPMKKGQPPRFDEDRTEDFYRYIEDIQPDLLPKVFKVHHTLDLEKLFDLMKGGMVRVGKQAFIDTLSEYMLPATDDEPMSPRVSVA